MEGGHPRYGGPQLHDAHRFVGSFPGPGFPSNDSSAFLPNNDFGMASQGQPQGQMDSTALAAAIMAAQAGFPTQVPPGFHPSLAGRSGHPLTPFPGQIYMPPPIQPPFPPFASNRRTAEEVWDPHGEVDWKRPRYNPQESEAFNGGPAPSQPDEPKTFKEFLATQDDSITPDVAQQMYQEYLKEHRKSQPDAFFNQNMALEWFRELYHPRNIEARAERLQQEAKKRSEEFKAHFDAQDPKLITVLEQDPNVGEEPSDDSSRDTLFFRYIPAAAGRALLTKAVSDGVSGELKIKDLRLGDVSFSHDGSLVRFLWVTYEDETTAERALQELSGKQIKVVMHSENAESREHSAEDATPAAPETRADVVSEVLHTLEPVRNREKRKRTHSLLPKLSTNAQRLKHDADQAEKVMRHLDKIRCISPEFNPITSEYLKALHSDAERVDACAAYLLHTHLLCYYTGNNYADEPSGVLPCPKRPKLLDGEQEGTASDNNERMQSQWERKVDSRMASILSSDFDRPRSGGLICSERRKERVEEWLKSRIKDEGPQRFRCLEAPFKLFKAPEFVIKHLKTKHTDSIEKVEREIDEEVFRENYYNDPSRLSFNSSGAQDPGRGYQTRGGPYGGPGRGGRKKDISRRRDSRAKHPNYHDLDAPGEESTIALVQYSDI